MTIRFALFIWLLFGVGIIKYELANVDMQTNDPTKYGQCTAVEGTNGVSIRICLQMDLACAMSLSPAIAMEELFRNEPRNGRSGLSQMTHLTHRYLISQVQSVFRTSIAGLNEIQIYLLPIVLCFACKWRIIGKWWYIRRHSVWHIVHTAFDTLLWHIVSQPTGTKRVCFHRKLRLI